LLSGTSFYGPAINGAAGMTSSYHQAETGKITVIGACQDEKMTIGHPPLGGFEYGLELASRQETESTGER